MALDLVDAHQDLRDLIGGQVQVNLDDGAPQGILFDSGLLVVVVQQRKVFGREALLVGGEKGESVVKGERSGVLHLAALLQNALDAIFFAKQTLQTRRRRL